LKGSLRLVIILACSLALTGRAQIVNFVNYGVEHGLPQSQVNTIIQGNDGVLWLGTVAGLSAYDGIKFKNYYLADSLAEEWITASFRDSRGNLWFGHWGGSITRYDAISKQFHNIEVEQFNSFQEVSDFEEDTLTNSMIFSTKGSGLFVYNTITQEVRRYQISLEPSSAYITKLFFDDKRNIWVGTENVGIFVLPFDSVLAGSAESRKIDADQGLSSNTIRDITVFDSELWVATNRGVNFWNFSDNEEIIQGKGQKKISVFDASTEIGSDRISCFTTDNLGQLWIGTEDAGVVKCLKIENRYRFRRYGIEQGLNFYKVKSLYVDRENTVWIGTDVGVNQYISDYFLLYDQNVGITSNVIWSIAPDKEGNIWLGTNEGVSQLMNADNISNDSLSVGKYKISGLSNVPIMAIYQDSRDDIWFGTATGNLFKRSKKGNYEKINIEAHVKDVIYTICEDDSNNIWIGTRSGVGKINVFTHKLTFYTEKTGLGGNSIYKIIKDKTGRLWFAVLGGKLTSYQNGKFSIYSEAEGIKHSVVLSLAEDLTGNVWIGCYAGGLYKFDGKTFTNYSKKDGMNSETPYCIVADNENNIWFGTTYGIEKFDQVNIRFQQFGKSEGFLGVEVNPNATCKDRNGNLWFGTILGAVKYNPSVHYKNTTKPIIEFTSLSVNQEVSEFPVDRSFSENNNNLIFHFRGISLNNPNKVEYKYRLLGHKIESWQSTKELRAEFTNLRPKKYTLEIVSVNGDNTESDPLVYNFEVLVPFYQAFWFYAVQVAAIGIMLLLAVFYGRRTGGSRTATVLASIAIIIVFEYGINYVEDNLEAAVGQIAFIKVFLNVILGLILFPVEQFVTTKIIRVKK
jgi:ligand-binding sensor domain-containing protein